MVNPLDFEYLNGILLEISESANTSHTQVGVEIVRKKVTTNFLIGADGTAKTVANCIVEKVERLERRSMHPLKRILAGRPFRAKQLWTTIQGNTKQYQSRSHPTGEQMLTIQPMRENGNSQLYVSRRIQKEDFALS